jgi:hypothetical protein
MIQLPDWLPSAVIGQVRPIEAPESAARSTRDPRLHRLKKRAHKHQSAAAYRSRLKISFADQFVEFRSSQAGSFARLGDGAGKALSERDRGGACRVPSQGRARATSSAISVLLIMTHIVILFQKSLGQENRMGLGLRSKASPISLMVAARNRTQQ